jgi:branched-subunit amino acid transport protein
MNKPFLAELRASTAYSTLRRLATFFEVVGYVVAFSLLVHAISTASNDSAADSHNALVALVTAVVVAILTRYVKLSACMFVDMADASLDMARMMREQFGKGSTRSD